MMISTCWSRYELTEFTVFEEEEIGGDHGDLNTETRRCTEETRLQRDMSGLWRRAARGTNEANGRNTSTQMIQRRLYFDR